ncbi:hypothetical protein FB107DRAFT_198035, partial [Schizophyllum commune]
PSDYLRSRCPACFGSSRRLSVENTNTPDVLVAIDACFSQKHNKQARDPVFDHPDGIMLTERELHDAQVRVQALRDSGGRKKKSAAFDAHAAGIRVPADALSNCEESFRAAQTAIAKANTGTHDVTAAMGLLC